MVAAAVATGSLWLLTSFRVSHRSLRCHQCYLTSQSQVCEHHLLSTAPVLQVEPPGIRQSLPARGIDQWVLGAGKGERILGVMMS